MGISAEALKQGLDELAAREPGFAAALQRVGYPEPRISERGYVTLLRTIVGQQVSVQAARAVWDRLDSGIGGAADPARMISASEETLRGAGLSRQKIGYGRSLAALVLSGDLDLENLPADDEEAIALYAAVTG